MNQKIGTFNCQGICASAAKQQMLVNNFELFKMSALAVQETYIKGYGTMKLTSNTGITFILYYSGSKSNSENRVGIILPSDVNAEFDPICKAIRKVRIKVNNNLKVDILSVYARTLNRSEKSNQIRENFYTKLDSILRNIRNRHIVTMAGDFNAKTGSAFKSKIYQAVIEKYGKGQVNTNGTHLLSFSSINNLKLVNTFFKHKPTRITTWTSPETPRGSRRNSYRNQIDYILVRKHKGIRITNAHSYGGMMTMSDHKLVMMSCKLKWPFLPRMKYKVQVNLDNLNNRVVADQCKNELDVKLRSLPNISDNKWKGIAQAINDRALTVLGKKPKHRFHVNDEIARLSKQQQEMRLKIENVTDNTKKNGLRKDRNEIMKTIHRKMKELDEQKLENCLKEIENSKNDSSRMFRVVKESQRQKPKIPLLIKTETGEFTINKKKQADIIAAHFKKQFSKNTQVLNKIHTQPTAMNQPFTR